MTVTIIDLVGHTIDLTEHMRHRVPSIDQHECCPELLSSNPVSMTLLLAGGVLCNDALLKPDPQAGKYHTIGDPTEGALLVAAAQAGLAIDQLKKALPRVNEVPFDSERKRMTTIHSITSSDELPEQLAKAWNLHESGSYIAITKGAIDGMVEISNQVWDDTQPVLITETWRRRISNANEQMAKNGMRVLGIAYRFITDEELASASTFERDLIFVGMVGMIDPPRPEVKVAVQTCIAAGIRPVMITGDHPLTASYIAQDLGIAQNGIVLTGQDLSHMSVQDLEARVEQIPVYARVSPEHKLKIVEAFQKRGHVVAMTGDGVNDAPALKKADIGVAMGITGTDVSKEASAMVLLDDNFSTIVAAVEEGRIIYDNVKRFVKFSIAGNIGKVAVMLFAPLCGFNVALFPLQLLWLNLLTDGLLGLGLGLEPAERDTMKRPPYAPSASIFGGGGGLHITWVGTMFGIVTLGIGYWYYSTQNENWQTVLFSLLAFLQVGHALAVRSFRDSLFSIGLFTNPVLLGMAIMVIVIQIGAIYVPFMQKILRTQSLAMADLTVCLIFGTLVFLAIETEKLIVRCRLPVREN
jgi:Ca2+-transporting ATPase